MVYSTKNRKPWLRDDGLRDELFKYLATILRDNVDSPALIINGVEDHIHALLRLSRRFAIMQVVQESKTETSKWLKRRCSAGCRGRQRFRMAGGIRDILGQCIVGRERDEVYRRPSEPSPTNDVPGRVPRALSAS